MAAAFVSHEVHVSVSVRLWSIWKQYDFLVSDTGRAVAHGSPDIFRRDVRIVFLQFMLARALGEFSQDQFNVIRVPRITGFPIMIAWSISMRLVVITFLYK